MLDNLNNVIERQGLLSHQSRQLSRISRESHGFWQFLKAHGRETQSSRIFVNLTECCDRGIQFFFSDTFIFHQWSVRTFQHSASLICWILFVKGKRRLAWACLFASPSCPIQYICKAIQWFTHSSHCFNVCCECDWLPNDNCLFYRRIHQIWYWLSSATSLCSMTSGASRAGECQLTHSRVLWSSTAKFSVWDSIVVTGAILELSCSQEAFTANFYLQSVQGEFFLFAVCSHAVIIYFGGLGLSLYWG